MFLLWCSQVSGLIRIIGLQISNVDCIAVSAVVIEISLDGDSYIAHPNNITTLM